MSKRSPLLNRALLISLVHERPAIWDKTMEIYKCKRAKSEAWREICIALNKDYERMEPVQRKDYFKNLIRMWTHIRDCWMKSMKDKRNKKELTRPYIYHEQLVFLKKILRPRESFDSNVNNPEIEQQENAESEKKKHDIANASGYSMEIQEMIEDDKKELSRKTLKINRLQFINLVRERPAIWDKTSKIYKNKLAKEHAWHEICSIINEHYEQMNQRRRREFFKLLTRLWNQIRDTWMRSVKNKSARPYKHHEKLIFLKKILNSSNTLESTENRGVNELEVSIDDETESVGTSCSSMWKRNEDEDREHFVDLQTKNPTTNTEKEDRNYSFFKSIQPTLAHFNDDQILEFQAGTISLLQKIKSGQNHTEYQHRTQLNGDSQVSEGVPSPINQDPIKVEPEIKNEVEIYEIS